MGWDLELAKDVCDVLGVACTINNVTFSDIIPALLESPAKYQMAFSSFTPTTAREAKGIDFITYYQAGEAWIVKAGGASISSAADMCGHTVAVESGTTEEFDAWGYMGMKPGGATIPGDTDHCKAAGKQDITVLSFGTQTQANSALLSGRADFGWLDQPVADYQVKTLSGQAQDRWNRVQRLAVRGRDGEVDWARAGGHGRDQVPHRQPLLHEAPQHLGCRGRRDRQLGSDAEQQQLGWRQLRPVVLRSFVHAESRL